MQACGLKHDNCKQSSNLTIVTPHAGVWIETEAANMIAQSPARHASCRRVD